MKNLTNTAFTDCDRVAWANVVLTPDRSAIY